MCGWQSQLVAASGIVCERDNSIEICIDGFIWASPRVFTKRRKRVTFAFAQQHQSFISRMKIMIVSFWWWAPSACLFSFASRPFFIRFSQHRDISGFVTLFWILSKKLRFFNIFAKEILYFRPIIPYIFIIKNKRTTPDKSQVTINTRCPVSVVWKPKQVLHRAVGVVF